MPTTSSGPSLTAPTSTLTLREKLLFSQAVHKVGAGDTRWVEVGKLLQDCPVIERPEGYWSEVACAGVYEALMQETGFDKQLKPEQQALPHAEAHLYLAQHFYELRMQELRAEIEAKEQKFRTVAAEINAIKSGEAIYSPGMMLRLRDILVSIRSKKGGAPAMKRSGVNAGSMDVDVDGDMDVEGAEEKEKLGEEVGGEGKPEVDVEMKVGDVGEGGKRTGGMAVFKAKDGVVWRMTMEDLRLAAQGNLPLAQKRAPKVVKVTKEDAPIQAQAPPSARRPSPELVDFDMDLATGVISQPASAGASKRTTPVPSLIASTKPTPRPRQPSSEIREDAPLQPQGPPVRLAKPPLPSPVPLIKETPVKSAAPARPVPRRKRGTKPAVSPDEVTSDVVPDNQERAESEASPVVQGEPSKPVPGARKRLLRKDEDAEMVEEEASAVSQGEIPKLGSDLRRRRPRKDEDSKMLVDEKEAEVVSKPEEADQEDEVVDEEVVPSSTAGDENRLVLDDEPIPGKGMVVDQSSEDDLTPPPMSPNLPPAQTEASPRPTTPVKRTHEKQDTEEKQGDKPEPSKRRKVQRSATPVTPIREALTQPSADELSPVPSTPVQKARGDNNAKDSDAEEESESEAEVMVQPKKRGRPRVRVTEDLPKKKSEKAEKAEKADKADEGDAEAGSRRTRRQEVTKRASMRNMKQDMSSPPPSEKRNTRASPERSARTRGNRTRPSKDKDEGEEEETDANGEEKAEEPAIVRRSGRHTRPMPDLREEEDEDENENDNEDEAMESAVEDAASPAATVDSEKRGKAPSRRNRDKDRATRGRESSPAKDSKTRDTARSRGKESPSPSRDTQRREGRRRAVESEAAEALESSSEKDHVEKLKAETPQSFEAIDDDETVQHNGESPQDDDSKLETPPVRKTRFATTTITTDTTTRQFKNQMNQLLDEISALKHGNHFKAPVKSSVAPGYYDIIRKPMDLKKIKANIKSGAIRSIDDFERDLWLIFCNAMMFNKPGTDYYLMAEEMMHWCEAKITEFKNAEANAISRS